MNPTYDCLDQVLSKASHSAEQLSIVVANGEGVRHQSADE